MSTPTTNRPKDSLQVHSVSDYSNKELEQELARRRLNKEQELLEGPAQSLSVAGSAMGPAYALDVTVGGLLVSAVIDTGSQFTIIYRTFLHNHRPHKRIRRDHSTQFKGKGGNPIAQVPLTWMELGVSVHTA